MMLTAFTEAVTTVATIRLRHRLCLMCKCVLSVRRELFVRHGAWVYVHGNSYLLNYLLTYLLTHSLHGAESFLRS